MTNLKRYRRNILFLICLISLFTLLFGCNNKKQNQNQQQIKTVFIDNNNITSFKVSNIKEEEKEIKSKSDIDKIIGLINSVNITKSSVKQRAVRGFGIIITYSNGMKFSVRFLATTMCYSSGEKTIYCDIDKNIVNDLKNYYDKN